ncbi:MAG: M15 family metallopeptidase [Candidatus Zambryskibacteria bacterium]
MLKYKEHVFMDRPIPDLSDFRSDESFYRNYPIYPTDEACVKVNNTLLCQSYYWYYNPRPKGAMEQIFLRKELIFRLIRIDKELRLLGLRLLIQEGYRPLSVQRFVQEVSVFKGLKKENPGLTDAELQEKVRMFATSVNGDFRRYPPPHLTGGAVDLTIVYVENGEQVDMGKKGGLYNTAFPDALERQNPGEFEGAKRFRRLLFWLASTEQMAMNPTEWWHLSWEDQMWAWVTKAPFATYGVAENFIR